jgi:Apea-like HEPN
MADIYRFALIAPTWGRSISDEAWQTIEPAHIDVWKSAATLLGERRLTHGKIDYVVSIDWAPTLRCHQRSYSAMKYLENNTKRQPDDRFRRARFPSRPAKNGISVTATSGDGRGLSGIIQSTIHDIFLVMNIAAPGCCDFYRASLIGERFEPDVSLSNVNFESALLVYLDSGWPTLRILKLQDAISWFDAVRQGTSQIPQNPMEQVLFALLHMSKIDISPMMVIWLFYAFESLLQTRVGENFSSIVRRLCLLLETNTQQSELLKKKMRALYDIRSAIVHGGFEVTHPMHNEVLDKRVNDAFGKLVECTNYGHAILLSCLQKTIEKGWRFPRFDETVRGELV